MINYKVQIIAPSSGVKDGNAMAHQFADLLTAQGFKVKPPKDLFGDNKHYYANTVEKRLEQLRSALLDPEVDIIWSFRGGYGSAEIAVQCLDIKPSHNKILMGASDITFLHGLFNYIYKMPSIHCPVGTSLLGKQAKHMDDIIDVLSGKEIKIQLSAMTLAAKDFSCKSSVTGGNLTLVTTMIGTKIHPETRGKILLLEDVGEKGYRVMRMLNHLKQAGLFEKVDAIVLGDFTNSDEHLDFTFEDFCAYNNHIPIFRCEGVGHGDTNIPVVLGYDAEIKNGWLNISSPYGK